MLALMSAGCGDRSTPPSTVPTARQSSAAEDLRVVKADVVLSPEQMAEEFGKDDAAFVSKFGNKVIEVAGTVEGCGYTIAEGVRRDVSPGCLALGPRCIQFVCVEPHPMAKALPGQKVTLRGRCDPAVGMREWTVMPTAGVVEWTIVRVEGSGPPVVAAEQLAKEFDADQKGTYQKYGGKWLIVTGRIQELKNERWTEIVLAAPGKASAVRCVFAGKLAPGVAAQHGWLKTGTQVRVLGTWVLGDIGLTDCFVLPPER
jgi:uncharacterized protein (DUF1330 family)